MRIWKPNTTANPSRNITTVSEQSKSESWNSNLGVMLAVAGSAVGFGNFLRFPGLAAQFGGGGHVMASGIRMAGDLECCRERVLDAIRKELSHD